MSGFKERMIEAVERGWCSEDDVYEHVRGALADSADLERKRRMEQDMQGPGWALPQEAAPGDDPDQPIPTCPTCGKWMRGQGDEWAVERAWVCDLHGAADPVWTIRGRQ